MNINQHEGAIESDHIVREEVKIKEEETTIEEAGIIKL